MAQMVNVNAGDAVRNIMVTVRVRGLWLVRLRMRLAYPFFWLGAKIAGTGIEIEDDGEVR